MCIITAFHWCAARAAFLDSATHPRLCMHLAESCRWMKARWPGIAAGYEDYAADCMIITRMPQLKALLTSSPPSACSNTTGDELAAQRGRREQKETNSSARERVVV